MTKGVSYPIPIPYSGKLFKMIRRLELDIIHAHHPFLLGEVAASFAQQKRVPLVYTFHTQLEHYSHYIPLNQQVIKGMARSRVTRYLNKCDLVIAPSEGIRGLLDSYGVQTRVATLANAIDTARFAAPNPGADWRRRLGIPEHAMVSLSVGRLGREKNLDFLLTSFAKLNLEPPEHVLVMVGDGTERSRLIKLASELGIGERVRFPGAVPYADMPAVYAACDLFVICSTTEVKPLVVLEALASGLPVLAVAACGTVDTLHHRFDGWLSAPGEAAYLEGWRALTADPAFRQELGAGARQTAKSYSFDNYMRRLTDLYRESIGDYGRRPPLQVGAGAV
jgi:glycosyltransferase involved in cell wall biosynthesis